MKILIIDNAAAIKVSGKIKVYKNTGEFGFELQRDNNSITYAQFVNETSSSISDFSLEEHGIKFQVLSNRRNKYLRYIYSYISLIKEMSKNDFIYVYYPNSLSLVLFLCILLNKKYGLYVRGQNCIFSKKSKILYKYAKCVFTVSDGFTKKILTINKAKEVHTIRPMISYSINDIVNCRNFSEHGTLKILYIGRLDRDKGIYELLDALSKIRDIKFEANIIGDGIIKNDLEALVNDLKVNDKVSFLGAITDREVIKQAYINSDLFVLPTYHEGFPRTLYEAMLFGTPILTTFVGGIPGLMVNEYNCLEIKVKSSDDIANKINFLAKDKSVLSHLSSNGLESISKILMSRKETHAQMLNKILKDE